MAWRQNQAFLGGDCGGKQTESGAVNQINDNIQSSLRGCCFHPSLMIQMQRWHQSCSWKQQLRQRSKKMSRVNFQQRSEGHRVAASHNYDIEQRLTYQQLLNLNNDLRKENMHLRMISNRLGEELKLIHSQFEIRSHEENTELYHAISSHPVLNQFENTLIPLFDCYDNKIQEFEHGFEKMHDEYFTLEKRFEEICKENQFLKLRLTETIKELMEVYKNGISEEMHSDFGQLIQDQIYSKHKLLTLENDKLTRDYHHFKAEFDRSSQDVQLLQGSLEETKKQLREFEISNRSLKTQNSKLKDGIMDLEIRATEAEADRKRIQQAHERAQSQNTALHKDKALYMSMVETMKERMNREGDSRVSTDQSERTIEQLSQKVAFLEAEGGAPSRADKQLKSLEREYKEQKKETEKLKELLAGAKSREEDLQVNLNELRGKICALEGEKTEILLREGKMKSSLEALSGKVKGEAISLRRQLDKEALRIEFEYKVQLESKDRQIIELQNKLQQVHLQRSYQQVNNQRSPIKTNHTSPLSPRGMKSPTDKEIQKMRQKLTMSEEVFREQVQIFENDLGYMRREADMRNEQIARKSDEIRRLQKLYSELSREHQGVCLQKDQLIREFEKVRNEYEVNLSQKQVVFEQKIRAIRALVKESEIKRKGERERVQEASQQYKKILQEIRATYEKRIDELEKQGVVHYRTEIVQQRT